jgi:hypothetical protein
MKPVITALIIFFQIPGYAQVTVSGTVMDNKGKAVYGANIYFEGTYEGTSSGQDGKFSLKTDLHGNQQLVASYIGYNRFSAEVDLSSDISLEIILEPAITEFDDVVITAGAFEASDEKKSVILKPFDIATTPSAQGDVFGALASLPGSQKVGESGKLFVRGGESYETRMYMDGLPVQSPFFSNMPDVPTRGRFSPLLFSGTVFSTGGYSAEYGQALSSVVALNTAGLEPEDKTSISIMTAGGEVSHVERWKNTSLGVTAQYINSGLHDALFKPRVDWLKPTDIISGNLIFREKTGESGMLKSFCSYYRSSMGMQYDNLELSRTDDIYLVNDNLYFNTGWSGMLGKNWMLNTGIAGNYDRDNTEMSDDRIDTKKLTGSFKTTLTDFVSEKVLIRFGSELNHHIYNQGIVMGTGFNLKYNNDLLSGFAESEINLSKRIALRIGARSEYNSYSGNLNFVPRFSAAYKTGKHSQISAATGKFLQNPGDDYLKITSDLSQESSVHYILNYQYSHNLRTFRIETYYKDYSDLIRYSEKYSIDPAAYSNSGYGLAGGFDIFWRDQSTFNNTDYWISYSYLDSERKYLDYPESVTPGFASAHNLSVVYKRYIPKINSFFGITYTYASGRPYHDPNSDSFMSGRTRPYQDISFNFTYVTSVFKQMAVIHLMANNIPGFENIYGYNFSSVPDGEGRYAGRPIISPIRRQIVLAFIVMI